ncbi:winged helix-turn-helix transcriptional regulator [Pediococcus pentosaceus]|uniref:winged helix-turn-helix transcriptional regulator n=1 Tax=Pediococcus pentosaceus TaxID=1255 RepID=UPI00223C136C|nr:winged helix-turn-helix transcriptional regulator [Pediococcus pentosaceus]MCT1178524.1 winged helix-turn-helix transcriptional regulator [Pediococcus pentosaceus]
MTKKKIGTNETKWLIDMYNSGRTYKKIANKLNVSDKTIANYVKLLIKQGKIIRRDQGKVGQRMHPKNMTYSYLIDLILMEKGYNYISAGHLNTRIDQTNVKKHFNNFKKWGISKVEDISDRVKNETLTNAYNEVDNLIKSNPDVPKELPGRGQRLDASAILHLYCAGYKTIYIAKHFSYPLNSVRSVIARARKSGRVTKKKNITDNQSKLLVKLYNEGQSYKKIARELNISQATATKYAKQLVKQGKIEPRLQTSNTIHFSDNEIEKLIELYNNSLFYKEIARSLNVSESTVKKRVKQLINQGKLKKRLHITRAIRFSDKEIKSLIDMYNNGLTYKEIAQALDVSKGVITSRVNLLIEQGKIIKRPRYKKKINCNEIKLLANGEE